MPMIDRRPNLAALVVPKPSSLTVEDVKTPLPHTPLACSPITVPMIMTPDTPFFDIPSICNDMSRKSRKAVEWTEQEDDMIKSYLSHPPRPLRNTYPPDSLPPSEALDEITAQIVSSPFWSEDRSTSATRARLLELARRQVTEAHLGPKREPMIVTSNAKCAANRPIRPRLGQAAFGMSRQQNSMDSLYGDSEAGTFSEALRLSSTLQDNASDGANKDLNSVGALASPLDFTFTFKPNTQPKIAHKPFQAVTGPRPASLLQRGKSFTAGTIEESFTTEDEPMSPASSFTTSPPSSASSQTMSEVADVKRDVSAVSSVLRYGMVPARGSGTLQNVEIEDPPITPLTATFFNVITPNNPPSGSSDRTSTPAITLTADSPNANSDTPRLLSMGTVSQSPDAGSDRPLSLAKTADAFAKMSLASRPRNPPPAPEAPRRTARQAAGHTLSRSLSDGMIPPPGSLAASLPQSLSLSKLTIDSDFKTSGDREHTLARPMVKRQRSNAPELSVFVPRPGGRNWSDELRSPFEHKPAGSGTSSGSSTTSTTPTLTTRPSFGARAA